MNGGGLARGRIELVRAAPKTVDYHLRIAGTPTLNCRPPMRPPP
jgi:hypothetical protein